MTLILPNSNFDKLDKFGQNADVDAAEDVWSFGGDYPFPATALATTIESSDAADTSAGTGAQTVKVYGVDADYMAISETVTLDGTTPVALTNEYLRVFRAFVEESGTTETNEGTIDIKHTTTVIAQIAIGLGQTTMAIYTVPADYRFATINHLTASMVGTGASSDADYALMVREFGKSWRTVDLDTFSTGAPADQSYEPGKDIPAKADIKIRITRVSSANRDIKASFYGILFKGSVKSSSF